MEVDEVALFTPGVNQGSALAFGLQKHGLGALVGASWTCPVCVCWHQKPTVPWADPTM